MQAGECGAHDALFFDSLACKFFNDRPGIHHQNPITEVDQFHDLGRIQQH